MDDVGELSKGRTMSEDVLLEPELEDLLSKLVEADKKIPAEKRRKFRFTKAWKREDSIEHPGLPGGEMQACLSNLEELERLGFVSSLREVRRFQWEFDVTALARSRMGGRAAE